MAWLDYLVEVPYKSEERLMAATENSEFKQTLGSVYCCNRDGRILHTVPTSVVWYIDNNRVSQETFENVIKRLELMIYSKTKRRYVWNTLNRSDGVTVWKIEEPEIAEPISKEKLRSGIFTTITPGEEQVMTRLWTDYLKEIDNPIKVEKDTIPNVCGDFYYSGSGYANKLADELYHQMWTTERDEIISTFRKCHNDIIGANNSTKENEDMLTITNYKYDENTATTTIWWSDKSQTSVTADDVSEATPFEGFCAACAKKLFGNKSTYLNQFDKWTVKIPARKKAEAEKKAAEGKAREEARAKRAAKRAERKAKRDIEIRAKQLADEYYAQEIEDEAEKIAHEKYGVPKNWFDGYSED